MSSSTRNSITSDGVAISFLFARPKRPEVESQKWSSLGLNLQNDRLWGVDPGVTDVFVASDSNQGKHEITCTSTKEYHHMCGYNRSNQKSRPGKSRTNPWNLSNVTCQVQRHRICLRSITMSSISMSITAPSSCIIISALTRRTSSGTRRSNKQYQKYADD